MIFPLGISFGRPQLLADEIDKNLKQIRISVNNFQFQSYNLCFFFTMCNIILSKIHFDLNCWVVLPQTQRWGNQMKNTRELKCEKKIQHDLTIGIFQRFRKVKLSKSTALFNEKMDN